MITADKVFKGNTEIIKVYKGTTLEWEKPIDVPTYSWNPTTYINAENNFYASDRSSKQTHTVTLTLPENVAAVNNHLSYYNPRINEDTNYLYSYELDSTTITKYKLTLKTGTGNSRSRQMECIQFPGDAAQHSIYFKSYSGEYYFGSSTYTSTIIRPQLIYHPSQIQSTYTKITRLFNTSGVWKFYKNNSSADDSDKWTSDFQIQGKGTYRLKFTLTSGFEEGEYASCKFYICDLDSDTVNTTLSVLYNDGDNPIDNTKTATIDFTTSDDNRHTIKIGGQYPNWGKYTAEIEVSSITHS